MNQNFFESTKSLPHLIVFKQKLNCTVGEELVKYLQTFKEEFCESDLNEEWLKYWKATGEDIVLEQWKAKYGEQLLTEPEQNSAAVITQKGGEVAEVSQVVADESVSWDDLWHTHVAEVYTKCYSLYSLVYYNYFSDLKSSLLITIEEDPCEKDATNELDDNFASVAEALANLGLPTSFGIKPPKSSKKRQKAKEHLKQLLLNEMYLDDMEETEEDMEMARLGAEESDEEHDDVLHATQKKAISKKKKRNRKLRHIPDFILEEKGMLKYWRMRFSLFSLFDKGIRLDRESWFSVTPEKVAAHLAERLRCDVIVDAFCGCGGNAIQFARLCRKVIAIDIDADKLAMAKHNAQIYGVAERIDFVLGDYLEVSKSLHGAADIVFLSPPWGGPTYKKKNSYDIEKFLLPVGAGELMEATRNISTNIAMFLPRNSNVQQIVKLAGAGNQCEIEHNYLDTRLVAITALYGSGIINKNLAHE